MVLTETPDYSDRILKYNCIFSGQVAHMGVTGVFFTRTQPERGPRRPHQGPLENLFKERSIYSNRAIRI